MNKLIEIVMVATVLTVTALLVMYGYNGKIKNLDNSSDQLVNDTGCEYAEQQKQKGIIDELPERCKTDFKPSRPEALPV